jgi:hypothetical protein
MPIYYQKLHAGMVDYKPWLVCEEPNFFVRGPELKSHDLKRGNYFSVVGAAEVVGVCVNEPFGTILSQQLKLPCLNLGAGGANMAFFNQPEMHRIIEYINRGKFLIVTLMSARQTGNSLFKSKRGTCQCVYNNETMKADDAWALIVEKYWQDKDILKNLVAEVRNTYVDDYVRFLEKIEVPIILFYFSQREPGYSINWRHKDVRAIWGGGFPHLVDERVIREILTRSGAQYAKYVSKKGIPYTLKDRAGSEKPIWNPNLKKWIMFHYYYPSAEMHIGAAELLVPMCREILSN